MKVTEAINIWDLQYPTYLDIIFDLTGSALYVSPDLRYQESKLQMSYLYFYNCASTSLQ